MDESVKWILGIMFAGIGAIGLAGAAIWRHYAEKDKQQQAMLIKLVEDTKKEIVVERNRSDIQRQKADARVDALAKETSVTLKEISAANTANVDKVVEAFREALEKMPPPQNIDKGSNE